MTQDYVALDRIVIQNYFKTGLPDLWCLWQKISFLSGIHHPTLFKVDCVPRLPELPTAFTMVCAIIRHMEICPLYYEEISSGMRMSKSICFLSSNVVPILLNLHRLHLFVKCRSPKINRQFNDVVCIDHIWLICQFLFHIMASYSRFSVAQPKESTALSTVITIYNSCGLIISSLLGLYKEIIFSSIIILSQYFCSMKSVMVTYVSLS